MSTPTKRSLLDPSQPDADVPEGFDDWTPKAQDKPNVRTSRSKRETTTRQDPSWGIHHDDTTAPYRR